MSAFKISPEDMARCQEIATKAANEAAMNALAEAIAEIQQCAEEEARRIETEEAEEAARHTEEEENNCHVAEAEETARHTEEETEATRHADADAMATSSFPRWISPWPLLKILYFLSQLWMPPPPLLPLFPKRKMSLLLDLSTVATDKCKVAPKPLTTFVPASKHCKVPATTPSVAANSTSRYTRSPQVAIMDPGKAKASKSSKASKGSSKATGTKMVKHTPEEMPQLISNEPINVELLKNNLLELLQHYGLNEACHALDVSHMCAYHASLAAELEQVEYAQNCIAVVHQLEDIAFLHSFDHLHAIHGISPDFTHDNLDNLRELANALDPWLPDRKAFMSLETALECAFALHTFNLHATSTRDLAGFPDAKATIAIKDFSHSLRACNLSELGGLFTNRQLYPLSLEDHSSNVPGPSRSSSVIATCEGNTEHSVDLDKKDLV
ncbi:hypothetical protein BDQ17DRAFT_1336313 [Cyathus striatus]|nr:hypothetical protein BDQ17DRAFT_1336313 [Cyathus striatus]